MAINVLTLDDSTKLYGLGNGAAKSIYQFTWDFAVNGGAVSSIPLTQINGPLPNNLIIQNASMDIISALTGGAGATGAVTSGQAANDLVIATLVAGAPFSTTGPKVTIPLLGTVATWVKTTAQRSPALVVAVNAFTAGKFNLWIEGIVSA